MRSIKVVARILLVVLVVSMLAVPAMARDWTYSVNAYVGVNEPAIQCTGGWLQTNNGTTASVTLIIGTKSDSNNTGFAQVSHSNNATRSLYAYSAKAATGYVVW